MHRTLKDAVLAHKVKKHGKTALIFDALAKGSPTQTFTERHDRMVEQIPLWKDEATRTREKAELSGHLQSQGWSEQKILEISPDRAASEYNYWKKDLQQQRVDDAATEAEADARRDNHGRKPPPEKVAAAMFKRLGIV